MRLAAILALGVTISWAQCAMCFRTAESQSRARAETLNKGIVIMLLPVASGAGAIVWLAYRRRARII